MRAKTAMGVSRMFIALLSFIALAYAQATTAPSGNVNVQYLSTESEVTGLQATIDCTVVINDRAEDAADSTADPFVTTLFTKLSSIAKVSPDLEPEL